MNNSLGMGLRRAVLPLAILSAIAGSAQAQIEEVVVTAQKRSENLQETPIAISALTSNDMEKRGILDYDDIVKSMPTLSQTPYPSSDLLILYMRGQGVSDPMQVTSDGSVGLYIDGLYISRPQGALFDLAGLERVEVLRGPQGTLYGRNTTGGAVNLITAKPTGEFGFKQSLSFGSRDYFRSLTTVDLPEVGDVAAKLTVMKRNQDGYVKNSGGADYGLNDQLGGRLALRWDASDDLTVDYSMETGTLESTPVYYQSTDDLSFLYPGYINASKPTGKTYRPIDLKRTESDFEGHGLTLTWEASDSLTIKSLTGYRELNFDAYQNYAEAFFVPAHSYDQVENRQFSQELQFIGDIGNELEYIVGLYYFKETSDHYQNYVTDLRPVGDILVDKDRDVTSTAKSQAIYSQVTWTPPVLDNRLELTLGGRYTEDERDASRDFLVNGYPLEINARNDQSFYRFDPSFTANFIWNDELSTYAKVSTGYKAGGSSEGSAPGNFVQTFDPEEVTTYELGLKSEWWDRRLRVNTALFYSEFTDMQLAFVSDPYDQSVIQSYNAGEATVKGAELSVILMPTPDLMFQFDYAYLDPEFDKVITSAGSIFDPAMNPLSPYQVGDNIKDLFVLPYAPQDSLSLTADYSFWRTGSMEANATLNYTFQSKVYDSAPAGPGVPNRHFYSRPSYGLLDARIGFVFDLPRGNTATVALWGRNVLDKEYRMQVTGSGGAAVPTPLGPAGFTSAAETWAEPATYGIDLIYEY
ncbi:TonB-dependent receptor [Parahaliea sp. F7430]|uniref:TonB-dependent receptor n=1 Tax=Sediminihaliea albiluteola TaxID=2758564 RepID=A0A7W2TUJ3_9GAMM|nr:TonB-dependent receptor [Sediminihaliea albiluteola]MBA6412227.1 TonB-dependent receptor [Sediminihaliea albiluteola]